MLDFVRRLIEIRKEQSALMRRHFFRGQPIRGGLLEDIYWLEPSGEEMGDEAWNAGYVRCLGMGLAGRFGQVDEQGKPVVGDMLAILLNGHHEPIDFRLPRGALLTPSSPLSSSGSGRGFDDVDPPRMPSSLQGSAPGVGCDEGGSESLGMSWQPCEAPELRAGPGDPVDGSLGSVQAIRPGDVNWMTAGRGIVHSERSDPELRRRPQRLCGAQAWVALPTAREEMAPAFAHHAAGSLPTIEAAGATLRIIAGRVFGEESPVEVASELFYADATLAPGGSLSLGTEHEERGVHLVSGSLEIAGETFEAGVLLALANGRPVAIRAPRGARVLLLGGARLDVPRHIWWNFVSSRRERIEQAKEDWREKRFSPVPGETDFIPLPADA